MKYPIFDVQDDIDEDECLAIYDNSYDFYVAVLKTFLVGGTKDADRLSKSYDSKDVENYRIAVHGLKGAAGSVGARSLCRLATNMDSLYKAGDVEGMLSYHDELINELSSVIELISVRLEQAK